ncbi:MAG: hypothetical protein ACU0BN_14015 [Sulfitobacter sp.]|uniref:hypothetical protein n=1 Tax=Sulfitobacter sp. TaxID=1903071 RepID=UPI0040594E31
MRKPFSAMNSVFQQKIKSGKPFDEAFETLAYRDWLEPFDQVFGSDVVADFAARVGVQLPNGFSGREHQSRSRELVAALAVVNSQGFDLGVYPKARAERTKPVRSLAGFGYRKLTLSESLVGPVVESCSAQIDWLEERIGQPMRESLHMMADMVMMKPLCGSCRQYKPMRLKSARWRFCGIKMMKHDVWPRCWI